MLVFQSISLLKSGFHGTIYDTFKFFLVPAFLKHLKWKFMYKIYWSWFLDALLFCYLYWLTRFIPSNFFLTIGFNNVMWTSRIISFIDNTNFNCFYLLKEIRIACFYFSNYNSEIELQFRSRWYWLFEIFTKILLI